MPSARLKPPIPEKPYYPAKGWNPDSNGLSIEQEECVDILNLRILGHETHQRSGSRRLAKNNPGNDPILHIHNQKTVEGIEKIYAFSGNNIWEYSTTNTLWKYAYKYAMVDGCEAVTNWVSDNYTPATTTTIYEGTNAIQLPITTDLVDTEVIIGKAGVGAMDWNTSTYTNIALMYMNEHTSALSVKVKFYSDDARSVLVESFDATLDVTTGDYKQLSLAMTTPGNWTTIKSWEIVADGAEVVGTTFNLYVDYVCGITELATDVTFWDTVRYTDDTLGEIVVAAGSSPPLFDDAEDDGSARVLLYYNPATTYFETFTTYKNTAVGDEDTSVTGPATASTVVSSGALANAGTVLEGSFSIYTSELGTLATASSILDGDRYKLVPTDNTKIQGGSSSFIKADGSDWSLQFLSTDYEGLKLYVAYTYKSESTYKPRFVWSFHNRLLMANTYEGSTYYPFRVRWTELGDVTLVTETSYADLVDKDIASIVAGEILGFYLTIYKTSSIVKCSYVGGSAVFLFNTVWEEGIYAGRTVVNFRNRHYLMSKNDIVLWDGMRMWSITQTLGQENSPYRTRDEILNTLNADKTERAFGTIFPRYKEYWLFIPGSGETYPSKLFIYSILKDIWYYFEFPNSFSCASHLHIQGAPTIDELIGTVDEQNWKMEGGYTEGLLTSMVLGRPDGGVDTLDDTMSADGGYYSADGTWNAGTAISTRLITRDFIFTDLPKDDRVEQLDFEALGGDIDVSYSNRYTKDPAAFVAEYTQTLTPEFRERTYFPDAMGNHIRFMFEATEYWAIRWLQPYAVMTEFQSE